MLLIQHIRRYPHRTSGSRVYSRRRGVRAAHSGTAPAYRAGNAPPQAARRASTANSTARMTSEPALRIERSASHRGLPRPMEPQPPIIATTAIGSGIAFSREERERHLYMVGKSGTGKSHRPVQSRHARHRTLGKGSPSSTRTATLPKPLSTPCRPSGHTRCATSTSPTPTFRSASTRWPAFRGAPGACRRRHRFRVQAPVARQLGTAA